MTVEERGVRFHNALFRVVDSRARSREPLVVLKDPTDFCRLILLRHPELAQEYQNRAVGSGDAVLSRRGRAMALRWCDLLQHTKVVLTFAADMRQCKEPAQLLADTLDTDLSVDARLNDQQMGEWQGRTWDEVVKDTPDKVRDFFSEFGDIAPPQGESLGDAIERVLAWWKEQAPQGLGNAIAVVLPGAILAGLATALLGMRLSRSTSLALPHGGLGILDVYANGAKLSAWNVDALSAE